MEITVLEEEAERSNHKIPHPPIHLATTTTTHFPVNLITRALLTPPLHLSSPKREKSKATVTTTPTDGNGLGKEERCEEKERRGTKKKEEKHEKKQTRRERSN